MEPRRLQRPPPTAADGTVAAAPQATLDAALGSHISAPSTELRHVSVLLCDLVDFTPFSEKHDIDPPLPRVLEGSAIVVAAQGCRRNAASVQWKDGSIFERFTDRARRVLVLAQEEARLLNHSFIGTEHILLGLIHEGEGLAAKALESLGISLEGVREKVEETIGPAGPAPTGSPPFTPRAKKVLELSLREALQLGHNYIGTEHMLLGLVREGEGVAAQVLVSLGADLPACASRSSSSSPATRAARYVASHRCPPLSTSGRSSQLRCRSATAGQSTWFVPEGRPPCSPRRTRRWLIWCRDMASTSTSC